MKTINLLFVLSLFVFASCETADYVDTPQTDDLSLVSSTDDGRVDDDPIESRFTFTAYVNGSYFRAQDFQVIETGEQLIIEGAKSGNTIVLEMPLDIISGDYNLGASIGTGTSYDFSAGASINGESQQVTQGSLTVLDHLADTGNMSGTFKFQTRDFEITRGEFKIYY